MRSGDNWSFLAGISCGVAVTAAVFGSMHYLKGAKSMKALDKIRLLAGEGNVSSVQPSRTNQQNSSHQVSEIETTVLEEQLVRNFQHFGEKGQREVMNSFVVIVGLGGVGSHCAISLARSGVKALRIVDFDRVTVSSLNRHAVALRSDVGRSKVEIIEKYIKGFSPSTIVECVEAFYEPSKADAILAPHPIAGVPSMIVDCIDNVPTKVDLIAQCVKRKLPVIVACGAGGKSDPCAFRVSDISQTHEDQLARAVRKQLKAKFGIQKGVRVVYSIERNSKELLPLHEHQEDDPHEYKPIASLRVRTVPVIGPLPAIMGQSIAACVLCQLAGQNIDYANNDGSGGAGKDDNINTQDNNDNNIETKKTFPLSKKNQSKLYMSLLESIINASEGIKSYYTFATNDLSMAQHIWSFYEGKCALTDRTGPVGFVRAVPWQLADKRWSFVLLFTNQARLHLEGLKASEFDREAIRKFYSDQEGVFEKLDTMATELLRTKN